MNPVELADLIEITFENSKEFKLDLSDHAPLLAAALRGMEVVDAMARRNATLVPPLPNEGLSPAEYEALRLYRAVRERAGG